MKHHKNLLTATILFCIGASSFTSIISQQQPAPGKQRAGYPRPEKRLPLSPAQQQSTPKKIVTPTNNAITQNAIATETDTPEDIDTPDESAPQAPKEPAQPSFWQQLYTNYTQGFIASLSTEFVTSGINKLTQSLIKDVTKKEQEKFKAGILSDEEDRKKTLKGIEHLTLSYMIYNAALAGALNTIFPIVGELMKVGTNYLFKNNVAAE
jgi:hypothetical protein